MKKKDDTRIVRTKRAIKKALYQLSEEKSFEKISVIDITKKANINRSTFYLHYKDRDDLLSSLYDETLDELKKYKSYITKDSLLRSKDLGAPLPHLVPLLLYIKEHPDFFNLILKSDTKYSFYINLAKEFLPQIKSFIPDPQTDEITIIYGYGAIISSTGYIFSKWIKNGMKEKPEDIAALITKITWAITTKEKKQITS